MKARDLPLPLAAKKALGYICLRSDEVTFRKIYKDLDDDALLDEVIANYKEWVRFNLCDVNSMSDYCAIGSVCSDRQSGELERRPPVSGTSTCTITISQLRFHLQLAVEIMPPTPPNVRSHASKYLYN